MKFLTFIFFAVIVVISSAFKLHSMDRANLNKISTLNDERIHAISELSAPVAEKVLLTVLTEDRVYPCMILYRHGPFDAMNDDDLKIIETHCLSKTLTPIMIANPTGGVALARSAASVGYKLPKSYQYILSASYDATALASVVLP